MTTLDALTSFYHIDAVRRRILEYCGAPSGEGGWDARAVAAYGGRDGLAMDDGSPVPRPSTDALFEALTRGADVARSLEDARGGLILLDVDYVDPARPDDPYRRPERCFRKLEPVYRAVKDWFAEYGIRPLVLMTGKGYHFVTRVKCSTRAYRTLVEIGNIGEPLKSKYESVFVRGATVDAGRAHEGIGRALEFLSHRVIKSLRETVQDRRATPLSLADISVGDAPFICLDISAYADPLHERFSRCAFSSNQKAGATAAAKEHPFTINLPRGRYGLHRLLEARRDVDASGRIAECVRTRIPDVGSGLMSWLADYRGSVLAAFHEEFDRGFHDAPDVWPVTYDQLDLRALPAPVRCPLESPNPALLQPVNIRNVALHFWERGWHPRSIAGLIRSKFERDYGWGNYWYRYDAASRADFYVRTLLGAVVGGVAGRAPLTKGISRGRAVGARVAVAP